MTDHSTARGLSKPLPAASPKGGMADDEVGFGVTRAVMRYTSGALSPRDTLTTVESTLGPPSSATTVKV